MARATADTSKLEASILELTQRLDANEVTMQALLERVAAADARVNSLVQFTTAIFEDQKLQTEMVASWARMNETKSIITKKKKAKRKLKQIELALSTEEDNGKIAALKAKAERVLSKFKERMNIEHGLPRPVKGDERLRDCTHSDSDDDAHA